MKGSPSLLRAKDAVVTDDGAGVIVAVSFRKNTNGGPGCRQYLVCLSDGRHRHYNKNKVRAASEVRS